MCILRPLLTGLILGICYGGRAQTPDPCGTPTQLQAPPPAGRTYFRTHTDAWPEEAEVTLPVVVHIIHSDEAVGTGNNLSAARVHTQLDVLNEDFRRKSGTPGYNVNPLGADIEVNFCAAVADPANQLMPEPGINRISRIQAGFAAPPYSASYVKNVIMPQTYWDPTRYVNIWVLPLTNGTLGFAQYPDSSGLADLAVTFGPAATDGVVISTQVFGRGPELAAPYNQGRTTTHEMGHWLGLWHIWGDGPCSQDDYCTDTPPAAQPNYGCPIPPVACGGTLMVENYMDYTDDACMNLFTICQKSRMRAVLSQSPRRRTLPASQVCSGQAPPLAAFGADRRTVCAGGMVQFVDLSVYAESRTWSFPGGIPASSTDSLPAVSYSTPGVYAVSLTVSNTFGSTPLVQTAYITVADTGEQVLFADGFENGLTQWTRTNPDNSRTWKTTAVGGSTAGSQAAYVDLYAYADIGQRDYLTSPVIDLRDQSHPRLRLVHAYRSYSGTEPDSLIIRVSVDSGQSFPHRVLALGGASMGTTSPATTSFFPQTSLDWCQASGGADCQEINLQAFEGEAGFVFRIESVNGYGNNLFIDQVQLTSSCRGALPADPAIGAVPARVYPNPARGEVWLEASVPAPGQVQCVVMNLTGQVVAAQTLAVTPGQTSYPMALPSVVPGWYLIRCEGAGLSLRQPLILE